jgi:hypothetical protein
MSTPFAEIAEGYAELGSFLAKRWGEHASKVAAKLDAGTYDADAAVADLAKCGALAAESGVLLVSEALEAAAVLAGRASGPHVVDSDAFETGLAGAALEPEGPFMNGHGSGLLPVAAVIVIPSKLDDGKKEFKLRVDATRKPAGTYRGTVRATKDGNAEQVLAWIVVP